MLDLRPQLNLAAILLAIGLLHLLMRLDPVRQRGSLAEPARQIAAPKRVFDQRPDRDRDRSPAYRPSSKPYRAFPPEHLFSHCITKRAA
ncbi:hypothetical protein OMP38_28505 [Cohnella ginsengisoli]|uniref:Uncharacterized protein n=1 Tax=Cohnella ginsengisoli TaxID=425004 RepID=A0A9X4KLM9_9BACL|nr:hypothetical protein [Cohnella ginsengisoli]MDG0794338.1 hypothetical protein [Cohnella ginsengisoli]